MLPIERDYAERKLRRAEALFNAGERHELLLALIELVEDAETLTTRDQPEFPIRLLTLRDHLREIHLQEQQVQSERSLGSRLAQLWRRLEGRTS